MGAVLCGGKPGSAVNGLADNAACIMVGEMKAESNTDCCARCMADNCECTRAALSSEVAPASGEADAAAVPLAERGEEREHRLGSVVSAVSACVPGAVDDDTPATEPDFACSIASASAN